MPFQPCPGIAQVNMQYVDDAATAENVYHVKKAGGAAWSLAELDALEVIMANWETADGKGLRATNVQLERCILRDLTTSSGAISDHAESIEGTDGTGPIDSQASSFCAKANTGKGGRSNRGRTFWLGMARSHYSDGYVSSDFADLVVTALNALIVAVAGSAGTLCVLSRYSGTDPATGRPIPRAAGIGTEILNYSYSTRILATQRRRLPER